MKTFEPPFHYTDLDRLTEDALIDRLAMDWKRTEGMHPRLREATVNPLMAELVRRREPQTK